MILRADHPGRVFMVLSALSVERLGLRFPAAAASGLNGLGHAGQSFGAGQGIGGAATSFATSGLGSAAPGCLRLSAAWVSG